MGLNTAAVQRLYIAYFNRPADSTGLAYWESQLALNSTTVAATQAQLTTLAARGFSGSAEYAALYAGQNNDQIIDNLYMNLFGRHAEPAGLTSWSLALTNGTQTFASIALQLTYSAQGTDATAIANKQAAATSFTTALDTTTEITGYSGTAAAATARAWLATVTDTAASVTAAAASMDASIASATAGGGAVGATYTLTTGVDGPTNFVGGSANDTFNAGTSASLSAFDNIDGGAGTDTLSALITTTALPGSLTVKNIETATINTTGAGFSDTFTGWTGLTSLTVQDATAGAIALTTASTTGVTVAGTGVSSVRIDGGGAVGSVTTGAGAVDIGKTGAVINAFTSLTVTGGTTVDISNNKTAAANSGLGTTLTAVSVSGNTGLVTVKAASLATLNLASSTAGATITATAGARTLGLNTVTGGTVTDATATSLTVNATGTASSAVTLTAGAATSVAFNNAVNLTVADVNLGAATAITVAGAGKLVISATTAVGVLTSVDASLNSGGVTITPALATGILYTGGSGVDTISLGATTKAITTGAGNDSVTISAAPVGGTIDAGAGTGDILVMTEALADAAAGVTATTTFAGQISNFEVLSLTTVTGSKTVNLANLDNISYVKTTAANALVLDNMASGGTVEFATASTSVTTNIVNALTSTTDVLNVKATAAAGINIGTIVSANTETVNFLTDDTASTTTHIQHTAALTDVAAKTITVTGDAGIALTTTGATAVTSFDASGVTDGTVTWTAAALAAAATVKGGAYANVIDFSAGLGVVTYTGGALADTINFAGANTKANVVDLGNGTNAFNGGTNANGNNTITGGTGADTIAVGTGANTIHLGGGTTANSATVGGISVGLNVIDTTSTGVDTYVQGAIQSAAGYYTTLTGWAVGDKLDFAAVTTAASADGALGAKLTLGSAASFANYLDAASASATGSSGAAVIKWFQFTDGNTYVVVDNSDTTTFADGVDTVICLTGVVNLATSTAATDVITLV